LTFDDGPGPYTPGVLSVLERLHVHATFFEVGKMLQYFSASTVRELEDGDVIGDHTETHPEMAGLSAHEQYEELSNRSPASNWPAGHDPPSSARRTGRSMRPPCASCTVCTC
jgi:peptidoglycan/xylan/chitin deacetylase (PgdA/CDA1 family)